jgi:hypothetical protein
MKRTAIVVAAGLAFAATLSAAPALATGIKRTFVSAVGDDANVSTLCQPSAPCRTFSAAYSVTIPDGEINVLDPGAYGTLTITHGLSIQGHGLASVTAQSGNAITINAGASDKVNLRGLLLDGIGSGSAGILFNSGEALNIQDSVIRNFTSAGIAFEPNGSSTLTPFKLAVSSTLVSDILNSGILILPSGTVTVTGVLDHVQCDNSGTGVQANGAGFPGVVHVTVGNSVMANNSFGIVAAGTGPTVGPAVVMVQSSTIANNGNLGLNANGSDAFLTVTRSTISGNGTGFGSFSGGRLLSFGDNSLFDNSTDGTATSTIGYH